LLYFLFKSIELRKIGCSPCIGKFAELEIGDGFQWDRVYPPSITDILVHVFN
jgi:hypothetical protein